MIVSFSIKNSTYTPVRGLVPLVVFHSAINYCFYHCRKTSVLLKIDVNWLHYLSWELNYIMAVAQFQHVFVEAPFHGKSWCENCNGRFSGEIEIIKKNYKTFALSSSITFSDVEAQLQSRDILSVLKITAFYYSNFFEQWILNVSPLRMIYFLLQMLKYSWFLNNLRVFLRIKLVQSFRFQSRLIQAIVTVQLKIAHL